MRAVVLTEPGPVENLELRELPLPPERDGWVRIRVEAFGLNRSELFTRQGHTPGLRYPRVLGIECAGVVDAAPPETGLVAGQKVVTMMGGMGRQFDGGYAEYTSVPAAQVVPIETDLPWEVVGALPEMIQTAYSGEAADLPVGVFQRLLREIAAGRFAVPVHRIYEGLEEVRQAHTDMEANAAIGKLVVRVRHR